MPESDDGALDTGAIVVRVVRTGGFAGLRREWTAEPAGDEAPVWIALIQECPWDAAAVPPRPGGADRFVWVIDARCRTDDRSVRLGDGDVQGPWRTLVDAVREFAAPAEGRSSMTDRGR